MLGVLYIKMHIGVIQPRIRVRNEISRFLSSGSTARSVLALLDLTPDSSSPGPGLLRAYFRSKRAKREVYELDPPPSGTSAENPGAHDLSRYLWLGSSLVMLRKRLMSRKRLHVDIVIYIYRQVHFTRSK